MELHEELIKAIVDRDNQKAVDIFERGTDVNALSKDGHTALYLAVNWDNYTIANYLLEKRAHFKAGEMNEPNKSDSMLRRAIGLHESEVAGALISAGTNVNQPDSYGLTPLHLATIHNNSSIIGTLLRAGADIHCSDGKGGTPLHHALRHDFQDIIVTLIRNGADQFAVDHGEKNAKYYVKEPPSSKKEIYIGQDAKKALEFPQGAEMPPHALLELCSAHRLGELFLPAKWRGEEKEALHYAQQLKSRLPAYWQERFDMMVDLAPLRREAPADKTSAVARYLAGDLRPGRKRE